MTLPILNALHEYEKKRKEKEKQKGIDPLDKDALVKQLSGIQGGSVKVKR